MVELTQVERICLTSNVPDLVAFVDGCVKQGRRIESAAVLDALLDEHIKALVHIAHVATMKTYDKSAVEKSYADAQKYILTFTDAKLRQKYMENWSKKQAEKNASIVAEAEKAIQVVEHWNDVQRKTRKLLEYFLKEAEKFKQVG